jgi:hypothetical protein
VREAGGTEWSTIAEVGGARSSRMVRRVPHNSTHALSPVFAPLSLFSSIIIALETSVDDKAAEPISCCSAAAAPSSESAAPHLGPLPFVSPPSSYNNTAAARWSVHAEAPHSMKLTGTVATKVAARPVRTVMRLQVSQCAKPPTEDCPRCAQRCVRNAQHITLHAAEVLARAHEPDPPWCLLPAAVAMRPR